MRYLYFCLRLTKKLNQFVDIIRLIMNLQSISADRVLNLLPIECIDKLIQSTQKKVYVLIERQQLIDIVVYVFAGEIYATYEAAINSDTYRVYIGKIVVQEYMIDSSLQTDCVYVLLNRLCYPQVITNNENEWHKQLQLMPESYVFMSHQSLMSSGMSLDEIFEKSTFKILK